MPRKNEQADRGQHEGIDEEVRQDEPVSRHRLRHEQLHRAAIDLAGHRARRPADGPDHAERQHDGMQHAHREEVVGPLEVQIAPAERRLRHLARPLEEHVLEELLIADQQRDGVEHRRDLGRDALRDLHPEGGEDEQHQAHDDERRPHVAQQLADEDEGHGCPWTFR